MAQKELKAMRQSFIIKILTAQLLVDSLEGLPCHMGEKCQQSVLIATDELSSRKV